MSIKILQHLGGTLLQVENAVVFFGNRNTDLAAIHRTFPELRLLWLKQNHTTRVVETSPLHHEAADGHWSDRCLEGVGLYTADCLPIMIGGKDRVWALHAGWRGLAGGIIASAFYGCHQADWQWAAIGPHIRRFEVGHDVGQSLLNSLPREESPSSYWTSHPIYPETKMLVDLTGVARAQLEAFGLKKIWVHPGDTYNERERFHSYRRDGSTAERQYSFVARDPGVGGGAVALPGEL